MPCIRMTNVRPLTIKILRLDIGIYKMTLVSLQRHVIDTVHFQKWN
jgi:hypothetical protein